MDTLNTTLIKHKTTHIPFTAVSQLSTLDVDYTTDPGKFSDFTAGNPDIASLVKASERRQNASIDRDVLVTVLTDQYRQLGLDVSGISALASQDVFTVTTAHQPALLTGPLYFIYKICSTIRLSRDLNKNLQGTSVVPVFVLGGEDHDFDEMNHVRFFGKEFTWETEQTGSVGRMSTSDLLPLISEIKEVLGNSPFSDELRAHIDAAFTEGRSYGNAMQHFVAALFADTELLVIQLDDARLKALFAPVIKDELTNQTSSELINVKQKEIENLGYTPQAYVRDINLFYLHDGIRNRIEIENGRYKVVDSDLAFSTEEMLKEVDSYPERFSPNVNLRPLYQETVLPNLAYIGGGGEIAYWLERLNQFEHYNVPFPILVRRSSVLYLDRSSSKQRNKLDIPVGKIFEDPEKEISNWVREHAEHDVEIDSELKAVDDALSSIAGKAEAINPSVGRSAEAFKVKMLKEVEHLGKRLVREEKSRLEVRVNQIRKLFDRLFPGGSLQERSDNFIPFYLNHGKTFFDMLIDELDPLQGEFIVIEESLD